MLRTLLIIISCLSVLLFSFCHHGQAQGVNFLENVSLDEGLAMAKKENKILFVDCMFKGCSGCELLDEYVFPEPKIGNFFNEHFISLKIDIYATEEGKALAQKYQINGAPTLLYFDGEENLIHLHSKGSKDADKFLKMASKVFDSEQNYQGLAAKIQKGDFSYQVLKEYLELEIDDTKIETALMTYLKKLPKEKLSEQEQWDLIERTIYIDTEYFIQLILDNYDDYCQKIGKEKVDEYIFKSRKFIFLNAKGEKISIRHPLKFEDYQTLTLQNSVAMEGYVIKEIMVRLYRKNEPLNTVTYDSNVLTIGKDFVIEPLDSIYYIIKKVVNEKGEEQEIYMKLGFIGALEATPKE